MNNSDNLASSVINFMTDNIMLIIGVIVLIVVLVAVLLIVKSRKGKKLNSEQSVNNLEQIMPENIPSSEGDTVNVVNESVNNVPVKETAPDLMAAPSEPVNNGPINEVVPEKQYANEMPALNLEETSTVSQNVSVLDNTPVVPEQAPVQSEPVINAFDMPAPAANDQVINDLLVDAPKTEQVMPNEPVVPFENPVESLELPQMVNEAINSDITVTKKCVNCGTENAYINKTCTNCGNSLE